MQTKTLVIAAVIIAATAALAIAPLASIAMAAPNGDQQSSCTAFHNGNGKTGSCDSVHGKSSHTVTTTCTKTKGKYTDCTTN